MAKIVKFRQIEIYVDQNGKQPYSEWLLSLKDQKTIGRIIRRIDRLKLGNFGDYKTLGEGIIELRLFFGPGYRIYCAEDNETIVLILCGGDKGSQANDINRAKLYWQDYLERKK